MHCKSLLLVIEYLCWKKPQNQLSSPSAIGRDTFLPLDQAECEVAFPALSETGVRCSVLMVG